MSYGIGCLSVVPVRAQATDRSEMVSQLLFGETFQILDQLKGWAHILTDHDQYEGWIDQKQFAPIDAAEYERLKAAPKQYSSELLHSIHPANAKPFSILAGSTLYPASASGYEMAGITYQFDGSSIPEAVTPSAAQLVAFALRLENSPYLWGGRTPFGIDCSGLVQLAARLNGIALPRDTRQQVETGTLINLVAEAKAGDLAFFDNAEGRIIHVGIVMEHNQIVHASGRVRIDTLDHQGIFNHDTQSYSHQLRIIKRIIP